MSSVVSRTLRVYNSTDVNTYLTFLSSALHVGGSSNFSDAAYYVDAKTTGFAQINSEGMNILFPNSTAHPVKAYISAYLGRPAWWSSQTARFGLYVNDTFIWEGNTSNPEEWTRITGNNIVDTNVINSTKSTSYKLGLYISSDNIHAAVKSISLMLYFNRYDFSAVAGTGISSVEISSNQGYDGDIINYCCVIEQGYVFDGWYDGSTKISESISIDITVDGSDLTLTAKAILTSPTIAVESVGGGFQSVTVDNNSSSVTVSSGQSVTLKAVMRTDGYYKFDGWYDGETLLSTSLTFLYTPTGNKSIKAISHLAVAELKINTVLLTPKQLFVNGTSLLSVGIYANDDIPFLCFTAEEDNSSVSLNQVGTLTQNQEVYTFSDGNGWCKYTLGNTINLNSGEKVYWKGDNTTISESKDNYMKFVMTGKISASGNIMSLVDSTCNSLEIPSDYCFYSLFNGCSSLTTTPILPATTLSKYCYYEIFYGCSSLTTPSVLPATTLKDGCYWSMYESCTSLTTAPVLSSLNLARECYRAMFYNCSKLLSAPTLPATNLSDGCYYNMFYGCTSIITPPVLPATSLTEYCYYRMFYGCTNLTSTPTLPATTLADYCYTAMFRGCRKISTVTTLPATVMKKGCYQAMFWDCAKIKTPPTLPSTTLAEDCYNSMFAECDIYVAPALPATTLAKGCYHGMFYRCILLNTPPALPATTLAENCYYLMFYDSGLRIYSASNSDDSATKQWRIPTSGTASNYATQEYMFTNCYGDFYDSTSVDLNTTFYIRNTPVS